jgi:hypothetical protein
MTKECSENGRAERNPVSSKIKHNHILAERSTGKREVGRCTETGSLENLSIERWEKEIEE